MQCFAAGWKFSEQIMNTQFHRRRQPPPPQPSERNEALYEIMSAWNNIEQHALLIIFPLTRDFISWDRVSFGLLYIKIFLNFPWKWEWNEKLLLLNNFLPLTKYFALSDIFFVIFEGEWKVLNFSIMRKCFHVKCNFCKWRVTCFLSFFMKIEIFFFFCWILKSCLQHKEFFETLNID